MLSIDARCKKQKQGKLFIRKLPNPDSDILSQIHVIVIAPHTRNRVVTITCFTLHIIIYDISKSISLLVVEEKAIIG